MSTQPPATPAPLGFESKAAYDASITDLAETALGPALTKTLEPLT
jgi:hypothetical protein